MTPGDEAWNALSYSRLLLCADHLARQMATIGVRKGDRVAALLPDDPRFVALYHALPRLGAVLVPLNTRLTPAELAFQVQDAEPRIVVHDCAWEARLLEVPATVRRVRYPDLDPDLDPDAEPLDPDADPDDAIASALDVKQQGDIDSSGLLDIEPDLGHPLFDELPSDLPRVIVYTSGTTGRPKGALLSHGNLSFSALGSALRLGVSPDDRWLAPLPLFHVGGMAILERAALQATTAVLPGRFDAGHIVSIMASGAITQVSMVPTMLERVMRVMDAQSLPTRSTLRTLLLGGGPISTDLYARTVERGLPVAPTYGLSEASSQVATAAPGMVGAGATVSAPAMPFTQLAIADAEGLPSTEPGRAGEILLRGATLMLGYWRNAEASEAAYRKGWLQTGDLGMLDARGWLVPLGRRDDLVVSGGENVYPAEVEAALATHPEVEACLVLGLEDPEWGAKVMAAVELVPGATPDAERLRAHLRERLAGYKIPRDVFFFDALPRNATGKLQRASVTEAVAARLAAGSAVLGPEG
jgi:O-succinylbenzoic acid--CoA ligase